MYWSNIKDNGYRIYNHLFLIVLTIKNLKLNLNPIMDDIKIKLIIFKNFNNLNYSVKIKNYIKNL